MENTKKLILGGAVVAIIAIYAIWNARNTSNSNQPTTPSPAVSSNTGTSEGITTGAGSNPVAASGGTPTSLGAYKDGTYTGSVANAFYGDIQVAAVISGGKLTDVKFLQYPSDNRESASISNRSTSVLKQEAIAMQASNVNIVSGATQTSEGFQQTLASALAQAKN